jgi:CheY-like chemotaxis protein
MNTLVDWEHGTRQMVTAEESSRAESPTNTEIRRRTDLENQPKCVLFLEDDPVDFEIASIQLVKVHLRSKVVRVSTADELLEYLRAMEVYLDAEKFPVPAVIVIDQRLPGADGIEAQLMLRSNLRFNRIPIIAISSPDQIEKLKSAVDLGADAWMTKPFNGAEFRHIAQDFKLPLSFETAEATVSNLVSH